jgi:segregation and condensation protein B
MKINIPVFLTLDRAEQRNIIEAVIFAASTEENLTAENIKNIVLIDNENINLVPKINYSKTHPTIKEYIQNTNFENTNNEKQTDINENIDFSIEEIIKLIEEINEELENTNRPYKIINFGGCYQFATISQYGNFVENMLSAKTKKRFTHAQLETLAIIAYKQPVTKQEIDRIRGVISSSEILNVLIEKKLIEITGRKEVIGKPLLYSTTTDFLRTFGLNTLIDLPKLSEIEEIAEQRLSEDEENISDIVLNVSQEDIDELNKTGINFSEL